MPSRPTEAGASGEPGDEAAAVRRGRNAAERGRGSVELTLARERVERALFSGRATSIVIGRYVLFERIGAGGMGVVYSAYDPKLGRRIALKLVRDAVPMGQGSERLLREAQALALVSHPNVVAVYDVGTLEGREIERASRLRSAEASRPSEATPALAEDAARASIFIAMEYVEGVTLRRWTQTPRRWAEVLRVMIEAGRGLAAVHAAGLVHRDFKPDNVMIDLQPRALDRGARVRVMDFGLARRPDPNVEPSLSDVFADAEPTLDLQLTTPGGLVGTPAYMAPEQLRGEPADARSDQFSFCVAAWEALVGERPFSGQTSTALLEAVARQRITVPRSAGEVPVWLLRVLRRGLAASAAERYPAMEDLVAALARDPSVGRRRRAAAGVVAVLGLGFVGWGRLVDVRERSACREAAASIAEVWNDDARTAARTAIAATGTSYAESSWVRIEPALDDYAREWAELRERSCVTAHVEHQRDGELARRTDDCLVDRREALESLVAGISRIERATMPNAVQATSGLPRVAACLDDAWLAHRLASPADGALRDELAESRRALADARGAGMLGRRDEARVASTRIAARAEELGWDPLAAEALLVAGHEAQRSGDADGAESVYARGYALAVRGGDEAHALEALSRLVFVVGYVQAQPERALAFGTVAQALRERVDPGRGIATADLHQAIAAVLTKRGAFAEAEPEYEQALEIRERALGADHPLTAQTMANLGTNHFAKGDYARAEDLLTRALESRERGLGADHPEVGDTLRVLSHIVRAAGDIPRARALLERALAIGEAAFGPDDLGITQTLHTIARMTGELGDRRAAVAMHERVLAIRERVLGANDVQVAHGLVELGALKLQLGELDAASAVLERARAILEARLGPDHIEVTPCLEQLAHLALAEREYEEALALERRALEVRERALPADHPNMGVTHGTIGEALHGLGRFAEAREAHRRALTIAQAHAEDSYNVRVALLHVARDDFELAELESARMELDRALAIDESIGDRDRLLTAELLELSGRIELAEGRPTEALERFRRALALSETRDREEPDLVAAIRGGVAEAESRVRDSIGVRGHASSRSRNAHSYPASR